MVDLSALFGGGDAKGAVDTGMNDLLKMGGNAGLGYLEAPAISAVEEYQRKNEGNILGTLAGTFAGILKNDKASNEAQVKAAIAEQLKKPSGGGSGGFGGYLSGLAQDPILKQYGVYIVGGVLILIAVGFSMRGAK